MHDVYNETLTVFMFRVSNTSVNMFSIVLLRLYIQLYSPKW